MNAIEALGFDIAHDVDALIRGLPPPAKALIPHDGAGHFVPPPLRVGRRVDATVPPTRPAGMPVHGRVTSVRLRRLGGAPCASEATRIMCSSGHAPERRCEYRCTWEFATHRCRKVMNGPSGGAAIGAMAG